MATLLAARTHQERLLDPHPARSAAWVNGREVVEDVVLLLLLIAAVPAVILLLASPLMLLRHLASLVGTHL